MPSFSYPCDLVPRLWRAFLRDDDDGAYIGSKDVRKVPEIMQSEFFEQACAFPGGVCTRQYWVGKHQAYPTGGTYNLEGQA